MADGAVVPFRKGDDEQAKSGASKATLPICPLCGRPAGPDHPLPPHTRSNERIAPRLPDGLATVLARTGQVSRRAREQKAAERARIEELAQYLLEQVALFEQAMASAGMPPPVEVRVGRIRGGLQRTWPVRHWRTQGMVVGDVPRTRHLYIAPGGPLFESAEDPGVASARGAAPDVERVELAELLLTMGELDAVRAVENVIQGLADLMKEAGATL